MNLSATIAGESSGRKLEIRSSVTSVSLPGSCMTMASSSQMPTTTHLVRRPLANRAIDRNIYAVTPAVSTRLRSA